MECGYDKEQLVLYLEGQLEEHELEAFEAHMALCAACRQELEESRRVWQLMDDLGTPEPSADARIKFDAMLDAYKGSAEKLRSLEPFGRLMRLFGRRPVYAIAYSLVLVLVGSGIGYWVRRPSPSDMGGQLAALNARMGEMQEMVMKSLLENPSASERIRGVSYTSEIRTANKSVIEALLSTLNNDPNINVRLMTLEALTHYADNAAVREGLVASILQQESPLVQAALADVMLKLQEKNAVKPFKKLLQQKDLNTLVRGKIEQAIARLG
jgi:HEAT repeat protein